MLGTIESAQPDLRASPGCPLDEINNYLIFYQKCMSYCLCLIYGQSFPAFLIRFSVAESESAVGIVLQMSRDYAK